MSSKNIDIIWLDDDDELMEKSEFIFNQFGFNIYKCTTPQEAMHLITSNKIKNLLLDVDFPTHQKEGLIFLEQLSEMQHELNVVVFTAFPEIYDAVKSVRDYMAADYLAKPIPLETKELNEFFYKLKKSFSKKPRLMRKEESEKYKISRLISIFVFALGLLFIIGGITTALLTANSETSMNLFGQSVKTSSIGVVFIFIGGVFLITIFKRIIKLFKE